MKSLLYYFTIIFNYYILNFTFTKLEKKITNFVKNNNKLIIFDVGCYKGVFTKTVLNIIGKEKCKCYLFDINKKVKNYIKDLSRSKNIFYNEIALNDKNGSATYNYNSFFESSGSSLSSIAKNDGKWIFSRKLILKFLLIGTGNKNFIKYRVPTITLDTFLKKKKIKLIDILKVDIDGSEYKFLRGANRTLKKNKIGTILIEICDKKNTYDKKEIKIINYLKKRN